MMGVPLMRVIRVRLAVAVVVMPDGFHGRTLRGLFARPVDRDQGTDPAQHYRYQ